MKTLRYVALLLLLTAAVRGAGLADKIQIEALVVTRAELRRHFAAAEDDAWRPATFEDLTKSQGLAQPDYLVVRFRTSVPAHYNGEAEAKIDGGMWRTRLNVTLHYNKGWVEYFIPLDAVGWRFTERNGTSLHVRIGRPAVVVEWLSLKTE